MQKVPQSAPADDPLTGAVAPGGDPYASLALAAAQGDRRAAEALLFRLLPRIRNLVRYLVTGDRDVADITQEAMIALLHAIKNYRGDGPLTAFADTITRRTTFAELRKRQPVAPDDTTAAAADDAPGADRYAESRRVVHRLDQLPIEQRHALVLHHVLELTVPEIAEELGVAQETVRSRLRLGRDKLKRLTGEARQP